MTVKELIPAMERTMEMLRALPGDIDVCSVDNSFCCSKPRTDMLVSTGEDIRRLADIYHCGIDTRAEKEDENGEFLVWRRAIAEGGSLRFTQCEVEKMAVPSVGSTGDGRPEGQTNTPPLYGGMKGLSSYEPMV